MRLQHFSHEDPMSNGRTFNYYGNGTWGPQQGVLGWLNPFSRDTGWTEGQVAQGNLPGNSITMNPNQYPTYTTPTYAPITSFGDLTGQVNGAATGGGSGGGAAPTGIVGGGGGGGGGINLDAILRGQREIADRLYGQAKGYYDEGMKRLGEKRGQFETLFNEGKTDILQGFEKGAGELQSSAMGAKERNAQALRAMGLGGSAVVRSQGRERQNEAKALASLQDTRSTNERGNRDAYQGNTDWANAQESSLSRGLENAGIQRQVAGQQQVESVANLFNNIISNQMAAAAAAGQYTANPYAVNIPDQTNALAGILSSAGVLNGGTTGNEGVNIDPNDALLTSLYGKKRTGVSGRGLYV